MPIESQPMYVPEIPAVPSAPPEPEASSPFVSVDLPQIRQWRAAVRALGARPCHEQRLLERWVQASALDTPGRRPGDYLPRALRTALTGIAQGFAGLARVRSEHAGSDGSARLLVELADGATVETVLLPRDGVCVSSQVGCAVGCTFCMTGRNGLARHLGSAEIVAQVALARARRPVKKVVFMGMGEPAHNLDNVMEAIELLGTIGGIGHKNLVFSTVGDARVFERLPRGPVRPALALSLHSTQAERRALLLPRAPRIDPETLVEWATAYSEATHYPIQYQWTLLEGVNDGDDEIDGIIRLIAGRYAVMNLIPFNRIEGTGFRRPGHERLLTIARALGQHGILTKLRNSAGQDVDAGCGQLRARHVIASPSSR